MPKEDPQHPPVSAALKRRMKRSGARKRKPLPLWHVVLLDDDDHTHEYVMEMLKCIFGHPEPAGFRMAEEVDRAGRAVVYTCHRELAELKRDQIHAYGVDLRVATCQGSMSATLELADT
jgi:ATP-dependent Clp protease adaptor protein ClpS